MKRRIRIRRRDKIKQRYWVGRKPKKIYGSHPLLETRKRIMEKGSPYHQDQFEIKHVKELKKLSEKGEFPENSRIKKIRKEAGFFRFPTTETGAKAASRQKNV
mgnify:CR=1 FL=1